VKSGPSLFVNCGLPGCQVLMVNVPYSPVICVTRKNLVCSQVSVL
jgi:hypothetical protein